MVETGHAENQLHHGFLFGWLAPFELEDVVPALLDGGAGGEGGAEELHGWYQMLSFLFWGEPGPPPQSESASRTGIR